MVERMNNERCECKCGRMLQDGEHLCPACISERDRKIKKGTFSFIGLAVGVIVTAIVTWRIKKETTEEK